MLTLVASAARTATGNSGSLKSLLRHPEMVKKIRAVLDVTAAATAAGDTLDVYLQTTYDGTNWQDIGHFTQVLGNGGALKHTLEWTRDGVTPESEMHVPQAAAIAAGAVLQGLKLGADTRIAWVVVNGTAASFTFSVVAEMLLDRR